MRRPPNEQRLLVLVTFALVALGLVMVFSATSAKAAIGEGDPMQYIVKQAAYAVVGFGLLLVARTLDYRRLRALAPPFLVAALVLCVAVLILGPAINGSRRWFVLGPVSLQPSEIAKLAVCIWAAATLSSRRVPRTFGQLLKPVGLVAGLFCLLIAVEDLGTAISLALMVGGIVLIAGVPLRVLAVTLTSAVAPAVALIWAEPYRRERILTFLDPWGDPEGAGYQTAQALIGIGSGGITGVGLGEGIQKINFLPAAHTDMIFAVIGEEVGLVGSFLVIAGFAAFAWAGYRIALRCADPFGKLLAAGITTLVAWQAAVNVAVVLSIAPLTGIPLPFLSYGGSSLLVLLTSVGILLSIAAHGAVSEPGVRDRSGRDSGPRAASPRGRGGAARARGDRDVRGDARPRRIAPRS